MDILTTGGENLAKWLHDTYEAIAKEKGWKTQEITRVSFDTLPKENQIVMIELAQCIQIAIANSLLRHYPTRSHAEREGEKNLI